MRRLVGIVLTGCVAACGPSGLDEVEREALMDADRRFGEATAERGVEGWLGYFAEDGVMFRPGGMVTGHDSIRALMTPLLVDTSYALGWEPMDAQVSAARDLGYTVGRYHSTRRREDGTALVQRGSYVTIWKKQSGGQWRVVLDIGSPDGPPDTTGVN